MFHTMQATTGLRAKRLVLAVIGVMAYNWQSAEAKDGREMELNLVVTQQILPGKEAEYEVLLREMEAATIANDKGCLRYEWYRSETPQTYILLERWTDREAVQAHLQAPHMVALREKIQPLVPGKFTVVRLTKM